MCCQDSLNDCQSCASASKCQLSKYGHQFWPLLCQHVKFLLILGGTEVTPAEKTSIDGHSCVKGSGLQRGMHVCCGPCTVPV